jgi:hypothetical protein
LEIEIGLERDRGDNGEPTILSPAVLKFGLADRVQLSLFASVVRPPSTSAGIGDVAAGVKWRLVDGAPVLGDFALLPSLKFPTGSERNGTGTGTTDASLLLISSHDIGPVAMDINAGYTRRSGDGVNAPRTATVWTLSFGGPARGRLGWVAEVYGYPATSGPSGESPIVALLGGPTFQPRVWLVVDAGVILPLSGPQPRALYLGGVYNVGRVR